MIFSFITQLIRQNAVSWHPLIIAATVKFFLQWQQDAYLNALHLSVAFSFSIVLVAQRPFLFLLLLSLLIKATIWHYNAICNAKQNSYKYAVAFFISSLLIYFHHQSQLGQILYRFYYIVLIP